MILQSITEQFADVIREVKADKNVLMLQETFFNDAENPLGTPQPYKKEK
jgi:hypothetical protein